MGKTTSQMIQIAAAGGGLIIDAKAKTTDQLTQVVFAAKKKGATIIIKNANLKTTDQLTAIAAAGSGNVIFDLSE